MAFDDLDEAIEEQDRDDDTNVNDTTEESAANDADATQAATGTGDIQEDSKDDTPLTEPAFEFSEAIQSAFYARDDAWDANQRHVRYRPRAQTSRPWDPGGHKEREAGCTAPLCC
jgi:hypothetical protein